MNATDLAAELIRKHEGLRLTVYDDKTGLSLRAGDTLEGHPTIGYGRCLDMGRGISKAEAEILLAHDLDIAETIAKRFTGNPCWAWLCPVRRAVLIDMAHNLGGPGLGKFVRFQAALRDGDYEKAADQMLSSLWASQVGDRAKRLARMMETGDNE